MGGEGAWEDLSKRENKREQKNARSECVCTFHCVEMRRSFAKININISEFMFAH